MDFDGDGRLVWRIVIGPRASVGAPVAERAGCVRYGKSPIPVSHIRHAFEHGQWPDASNIDATTGQAFSPKSSAQSWTVSEIRDALNYDPETGVFTWKKRIALCQRVGAVAGGIHKSTGYIRIRIGNREWLAHRLAWLYMTGQDPPERIDHIDGNRTNNRWANLRASDSSLNLQNLKRATSRSTTGLLGVGPHGKNGFRATIKLNGKGHHIGSFPTAELAHEAYLAVKRKIHPACTL